MLLERTLRFSVIIVCECLIVVSGSTAVIKQQSNKGSMGLKQGLRIKKNKADLREKSMERGKP